MALITRETSLSLLRLTILSDRADGTACNYQSITHGHSSIHVNTKATEDSACLGISIFGNARSLPGSLFPDCTPFLFSTFKLHISSPYQSYHISLTPRDRHQLSFASASTSDGWLNYVQSLRTAANLRYGKPHSDSLIFFSASFCCK